MTTAPNPSSGDSVYDGPLLYTVTTEFNGLRWIDGLPGDSLTLKGFSTLPYGQPDAYNWFRNVT